ncbi:ATPase subunit of ABC transporter with duplicated ATPase domains [Povalibacter uvarum]|uniref:ATPase subunit of ABC transporter with duplicated ATPase domains n=1 Tax=Povalibacter uvarum TaxID=732238 RepID=A0A841HVQ6_9GAMM|nr:ATP-binding cassette domain-containing protein [Povalibacter uvarum]MBB6096280.1 ATPase subunit of ABC transporter with duplicated ATPase domains [Povalibacter uvarum]
MPALIVAHDVSYELANGRELFSRLSLSLDAGLTALVGPNGVGKTLLARLLAAELEPTHGVIRRTVPVRLFAQRQIPPEVSVDEYLVGNGDWSLLRDQLLAGVDRRADCRVLSGGEWMRVRLARALNEDFLILDEPTNDLDRDGRRLVGQFLGERAGGTLLISHDRELLELCTEFLELSNRGLMRFSGGWQGYSESKESEAERLGAALEQAKRERDRLHADRVEQKERQEKRNRRGAANAARGGMPRIIAGGLKRRAQQTSGRLDRATLERAEVAVSNVHAALRERKIDPVMYADVEACSIPAQKLVAEARGFNIRLSDWLFGTNLDFTWRGNVRVALRGPNGSGKTTLLRALMGEALETRGEWRRGDLSALYIDQRCGLLDDGLSVFDNVRAVSSVGDTEIRTGLARFLFAGDAAFQPVGQLSGGERLRAALARGFMGARKPELMVLDEPTNNLDLVNIEFLEGLVRRFHGALVVVSHDERFLEGCALTAELLLGRDPH